MADSEPGGLTLTTRSVPPQLEVLYNEDLLIDILSFFDPYAFFEDLACELEDSTRHALFFACLTCKSFVKPALDLLWRYMTSLTPLFSILPTFVKVNDVYMFTDVIQPIHMERFRMYARKIRGLEILECPENIAGHCIHRLLTISNMQPFFPALTAVQISAPSDPNAIENYAPLFLIHGNLLSDISVDGINAQNESLISSFLLYLSDKTPTLQHIGLFGKLSPQILGFLKTFRRLQNVSLSFHTSISNSPITASVLQDLGDLPDLRYMWFHVDGRDFDDTTLTIRKGTIGFQALDFLNLSGPFASLQKILRCISVGTKLTSITLSMQGTSRDEATQASVQECIAEMCRVGRNVKKIDLFTTFGGMPIPSSSISLSPFVLCRRLSSLKTSGVPLPANLDESIRFLCENGAWQNMRVLELRPRPSRHAEGLGSMSSLTSLRILAQSCPRLIEVTIPIDFAQHTPSSLQQERQHPRTPYHPLKRLSVVSRNVINDTDEPDSSTQIAGLVARFLEHYFPKLVGGRCQLDTYDQGDLKWWIVVKMMMEQLSSLRAETESTMTEQTNL